MTIQRVRPADWGIGEKLTSGQMNGVDTNTSYALDKRLGETDTLESVVACANGGRIIVSQGIGADANASYAIDDGNSLIYVPTLTADREYTLSDTGALQGDVVSVYVDPTVATYGVLVRDASLSPLFLVGNEPSADGPFASFIYAGGAWRTLEGRRARFQSATFTSGAFNWTCPRGITQMRVVLIGGGGGGGGGHGGGANCIGGSGGGGAELVDVAYPTSPGTTYSGSVGAGGTPGSGGAISSVGSDGGDGGDSTFDTLTARGAGRGLGGQPGSSASWVAPGTPVKGLWTMGSIDDFRNPWMPGMGGWARGTGGVTSKAGANRGGAAGGTGGSSGSSPGGFAGGGGGGGGGPSGWAGGNGGAGGNGANGNSGGIAATPVAGGGGALWGAGGGGGGAGGTGSGGSTAGASGGAGFGGIVTIIYVK